MSSSRSLLILNRYLGYYTDNGAFYYYFTAPSTNYDGAMRAVHDVEVVERGIPFKYLQLDSFWYFKGANDGVVNWTATPATFPKGLRQLSDDTGWNFVAHNR